MKKIFVFAACAVSALAVFGCSQKSATGSTQKTSVVSSQKSSVASSQNTEPDGAYDFIIYESDSNNDDLSDNPVVARYHIEYVNATTIPDTLIKNGSTYYFSKDSEDYLILTDSGYGLSYSEGYFKNYSGCSNGKIDVSWSKTYVNGTTASLGIGATTLEGLKEYGFVINGWK